MKVKVEGLKELDQALGQLPFSTAKNVLRRVGRAALEPMDEAWREKAPEFTGELAESGSVGSGISRRQRRQHVRASTVEVFAGPGPNPQAVQQEFGNSIHPPQPFMRPAWDETKDQALEIVKTELGAEIQKAVDRAARKAARIARKIG